MNRFCLIPALLSTVVLFSAPSSASAQTGAKTYEVTVTNITTSKQGLSPLILATHPASTHAWQMGQTATAGLELLAEEGMPDALASEWRNIATDVTTTKAHLLPGDSITVRIRAKEGDVLSAASMLIQTNDGFTGLDAATLSDGASMDSMAYDAGTEENTEKASDVPGPPFVGKNSGPASQPAQPVAMHIGIAGKADVGSEFNWSGPVVRFSVRMVANTPMMLPTTSGTDSAVRALIVLLGGLVLIGLGLGLHRSAR